MHRIAPIPGGWNSDAEGVIFLEQTPAPIVILTAADTDIQTLAVSLAKLPPEFPAIRVANLLQLQQQLSIDRYADTVLSQAKVIVLRLLGGRSYWSYGLEVVREIAEDTRASLFILPGDDRPDPEAIAHSTVPLAAVNRLWRYWSEGGRENIVNALKFIADTCLGTQYCPLPPQEVPRIGLYSWQNSAADCAASTQQLSSDKNSVAIIFYRAHYLAGNTLPIDALCQALAQNNLNPLPIFVSSLREPEIQEVLLSYCQPKTENAVQLLLNTTSFSLAKLDENIDITDSLYLWQQLDITVLQVIFSSGTEAQWESSLLGLSPRDIAMNIALPEVDGRIITRAISFKSVKTWNSALETDVVIYQPRLDRINWIADLAANWVRLKNTPIADKKIALILANYPNRDSRIANGVGLDTPASCIAILQALKAAGYLLENIPETGDELIRQLTASVTNDLETQNLRPINQSLSLKDWQQYFSKLPETIQQAIIDRWGKSEHDLAITGSKLGNIFVGIQPARGYDRDPSLNYHAPDLEPTPEYLAYYYWLKTQFMAQAIIHIGKHGNLEWLPGKSIALSSTCYPEIALGTLPNFYPFIVNDPGEGAQAKRRSHAVIIDHLTPPLTRAELYGDLAKLETLIDEYYEAQTLDPSRLKTIGDRIAKIVSESHLDQDLGIDSISGNSLSQFLTRADGYLCELKEAQIRDGLHIFGQCPHGKQLRDLIAAIARSPSLNRLGLTCAIAQDLDLDFNPLTASLTDEFSWELPATVESRNQFKEAGQLIAKLAPCRTVGDVVTVIEEQAAELIEILIQNPISNSQNTFGEATKKELAWIKKTLLPALQQTPQEIVHLLDGLNGKYVPSGPSGAPTRGKPEVLPTGRNFYSVDIRGIPTETAWEVGRKAAEALIERYTQENGEYPQTVAISIWGTSTMRTGGDDVAQVMALLGVKPIWDGASRRVIDWEILSVAALGRPRVDVTVRVSGFFRDSFPNLLDLLYQITTVVSSLEEEKAENPLAETVRIEQEFWQAQGLTEEQAKVRASYRIFGSKPGAYGAGLQGLIEAQNWQGDADLAQAYINWSCYAYDRQGSGHAVPEVFEQRLKQLQIVLHNQDNREHDLLDSDDYYQFQGGLAVAVRSLTGKNPQAYFGDNSLTDNPKVRLLREEIARVYRSRVVNPKWIAGVMRHGYKGAFEMAATVDYLFAYDATANCVEDFMYQGIAEAYIFKEDVQKFIQESNPWSLRDMAERLLEANQRGLWKSANQKTLDKLRTIVHEAEGIIEQHSAVNYLD